MLESYYCYFLDMFTASIESNKAFNQSDRQPVNNRSFRRTSTLTAPTLDGRTFIDRRAPSAIPADGGFVGNMDGRRQRFSRYDQHQQQRQTTGTVVNGQRPTPGKCLHKQLKLGKHILMTKL